MNYNLGVDIGTSSAKAVAYSDRGGMVARASVSYGMRHPLPDRSEQDPEEILRAVRTCIEEVIAAMGAVSPGMVAFSAAMHSLLGVDVDGVAITPCMIWADNRASGIAASLKDSEEGRRFYESTGTPVHAMTPFCKLLWLREHEVSVFEGASRFVGIKEYVFYHLFGEWIVDSGVASATGLLNIRSLEWDEDILRYCALDCSKLARVVPPGHVIYYDVARGGRLTPLTLAQGTPIVVGCSDGALANLATGAIGEHAMAITIGTSGAARRVVSGPELDPEMRSFCYHVYDDLYIRGGASNNGAVVIQWLKEKLLMAEESYEELLKMAVSVEPGSEGLLFVPYILGERAPIWNSNARGVYFGLDIRHEKAHMVRATMEGILFGLYGIGKTLGGMPFELHATGGFAKSPLWLQMLADVFNVRVLAFDEEDSSALGAVVMGLKAMGGGGMELPKAIAVYEPDAVVHKRYVCQFDRFSRVYEALKGEF